MENEFLDNTEIISYSAKTYEKTSFSTTSKIQLSRGTDTIEWLNIKMNIKK
jgi:magnesium transporter